MSVLTGGPAATDPDAHRPPAAIESSHRIILARVSLLASGLFVLLLAMLHLLRPELDPSWRVVSEYGIGRFGWMMNLAFISLGVACLALIAALWPPPRTAAAWIGVVLLAMSACGLLLAGVFTTDSLTAPATERTTAGRLHELGAMLDFVPLAALILSLTLSGRGRVWHRARVPLLLAAAAAIACSAYFIYALSTQMPADGLFGPDVTIGWPNRLLILGHTLWLATAAWFTLRANSGNQDPVRHGE